MDIGLPPALVCSGGLTVTLTGGGTATEITLRVGTASLEKTKIIPPLLVLGADRLESATFGGS